MEFEHILIKVQILCIKNLAKWPYRCTPHPHVTSQSPTVVLSDKSAGPHSRSLSSMISSTCRSACRERASSPIPCEVKPSHRMSWRCRMPGFRSRRATKPLSRMPVPPLMNSRCNVEQWRESFLQRTAKFLVRVLSVKLCVSLCESLQSFLCKQRKPRDFRITSATAPERPLLRRGDTVPLVSAPPNGRQHQEKDPLCSKLKGTDLT